MLPFHTHFFDRCIHREIFAYYGNRPVHAYQPIMVVSLEEIRLGSPPRSFAGRQIYRLTYVIEENITTADSLIKVHTRITTAPEVQFYRQHVVSAAEHPETHVCIVLYRERVQQLPTGGESRIGPGI